MSATTTAPAAAAAPSPPASTTPPPPQVSPTPPPPPPALFELVTIWRKTRGSGVATGDKSKLSELLKAYHPERPDVTEMLHSMEMFVYPAGDELSRRDPAAYTHSFIKTQSDGSRMYGHCYTVFQRDSTDFPVPLTLAIFSHYPMYQLFQRVARTVLDNLLRQSQQAPVPLSDDQLCAAVVAVLCERPTPPLGERGWLQIDNEMIEFTMPEGTEQSENCFDVDYTRLFALLEPTNVILFFTALLNEKQVIVSGSKWNDVLYCVETALHLIRPFRWACLLVPIVPLLLLDFLHAPMPYIMGVTRMAAEITVFPAEAIVVDLDRNRVRAGSPLVQLPPRLNLRLFSALHRHGNLYFYHHPELAVRTSTPPPPSAVAALAGGGGGRGGGGQLPGAKNFIATMRELQIRDSVRLASEANVTGALTLEPGEPDITTKTATLLADSDEDDAEQDDESPAGQVHWPKLQEAFLSIFLSLFKFYTQFVRPDAELGAAGGDALDPFDSDGMLAETAADCVPLVRRILESQMFAWFLQERLSSRRFDAFDLLLKDKIRFQLEKISVLSNYAKDGTMWKQGHRRKNWKFRHFKLGAESMELAYFTPKDFARIQQYKRDRKMGTRRSVASTSTSAAPASRPASVSPASTSTQSLSSPSPSSSSSSPSASPSLTAAGVKPKGVIKLVPGETRITVPRGHAKQPTAFPFSITTASHYLLMCAESSEARREWIRLLKAKTNRDLDAVRTLESTSPLLLRLNAKKRSRVRELARVISEIRPRESFLRMLESQEDSSIAAGVGATGTTAAGTVAAAAAAAAAAAEQQPVSKTDSEVVATASTTDASQTA